MATNIHITTLDMSNSGDVETYLIEIQLGKYTYLLHGVGYYLKI